MASHIRFSVHQHADEEPNEESDYNAPTGQSYRYNQTESLLRLLAMANSLRNQSFDHVQFAMERSAEEQDLRRNSEIVVDVNSQQFNTTDKKYTLCSICTDEYQDNTNVSILDCGHVFHPKCIREWGKYNAVCPLCKEEIPTRPVRRYLAR